MQAMAPSEQGKKDLANKVVQDIVKELVESPSLADLTDFQLKQVAQSVLGDNLKSQLQREVDKARADIGALTDRWLNSFDSPHTKKSFQANLGFFLDWLNVHFLDVGPQEADDYAIFLQNARTAKGSKITANTQRQRIAAVSSFYRNLVRWGYVAQNPFLGVRLPKKEIQTKTADQIPSNAELNFIEALAENKAGRPGDRIENEREREGARKALIAIIILRATGLRSGVLPNIKIDDNGYYRARTKGNKEVSGQLDPQTLKKIKRWATIPGKPLANYKSFSMWLRRLTGGDFSAHTLRHKFAIDHYQENKDIAKLQKLLGHADLNTTTVYLSGLGFDL